MFAILNDAIMSKTELVNINFQVGNIFGLKNFEGTTFYMFDLYTGATNAEWRWRTCFLLGNANYSSNCSGH